MRQSWASIGILAKINGQYPYYSVAGFWGWLVVYAATCLLVGIVAQKLYTGFLAPLWKWGIDAFCKNADFSNVRKADGSRDKK